MYFRKRIAIDALASDGEWLIPKNLSLTSEINIKNNEAY